MALSPQTAFADAGGVRLHFQSFGAPTGPAVLMIMGVSAPMTRWPTRLCEDLALQGYRIIRYDNRDSGASQKYDAMGLPSPGRPCLYTLDDFAMDGLNLLTALRVRTAHLVGVSMGGAIAQQAAALQPDRVISLVSIMSTSGDPTLPGSSKRVRDIFRSAPRAQNGVPERRTDQIAALLASAEAGRSPAFPVSPEDLRHRATEEVDGGFTLAGRTRQAAALLSAGNRHDALRQLRVPTTIIHGDADELFPLAHGLDLVETIPDATLIVVEGLGHDLPEPAVPILVEAISAGLRRGEASHPTRSQMGSRT